jgi:putative transcriptional regulator
MSEIDLFKIEHNKIEPERGRILISEPFADDFYFKRSVVLLIEHNEHGSMGFILNNYSIKIPVTSILRDMPDFGGRLSLGGPVSTDSLFYMHTLGSKVEGSIPIMHNLYWGGDFDEIKRLITLGTANETNLRFFLGYSGWSEGQLASEISRNSWLVSESKVGEIMNTNEKKNLWKQSLKNLGQKYELWANFPEDPNLN